MFLVAWSHKKFKWNLEFGPRGCPGKPESKSILEQFDAYIGKDRSEWTGRAPESKTEIKKHGIDWLFWFFGCTLCNVVYSVGTLAYTNMSSEYFMFTLHVDRHVFEQYFGRPSHPSSHHSLANITRFHSNLMYMLCLLLDLKEIRKTISACGQSNLPAKPDGSAETQQPRHGCKLREATCAEETDRRLSCVCYVFATAEKGASWWCEHPLQCMPTYIAGTDP